MSFKNFKMQKPQNAEIFPKTKNHCSVCIRCMRTRRVYHSYIDCWRDKNQTCVYFYLQMYKDRRERRASMVIFFEFSWRNRIIDGDSRLRPAIVEPQN